MTNKTITNLSELGEFGLIERITKTIELKNQSTVVGIGDDAAVLEYPNSQIVITTDLLVEGIHFDLTYVPLKHLGYKSAVVNFSDCYAMNAQPRQITVAIAISSKFSVEAIEEIYKGIKLACDKYQVDLVGGDTSSSLTGLMISVTAIGEVQKDKITYRNTAKINDLVCVSGDLGAAYMGLLLLEREKEVFKVNPNMKPDLEGYDYILERQLKPEARKDICQLFKELDIIPTSMIDISDGLSSEILHVCNKLNVGCAIYEEKIPIHEETKAMAAEFGIDPTISALSGGEDYELLFTISLNDFEKVKNILEFTIIGHITEPLEGVNLIARDGTQVPIVAQGWNAMKK